MSKLKEFTFIVKTGLKPEARFSSFCKAVIISNYDNSGEFSLSGKLDKFLASGTSRSERLPLDNYQLHDTIPLLALNFSPLNFIACHFVLASRYEENRNS